MQHDSPSVAGEGEDAPSFEELYARNVTAIYHFIYSKVGNREEAEDLTSQVFIKAARGLDPARRTQSIQAWLFQVARTTVADHWREFYRLRTDSLERLLETGLEVAADTASAPAREPDERVQALLCRLPERYRDVLTNRFLLNLSIRETAEKMGLSEANVKVLQYRALHRASSVAPDTLAQVPTSACDS
ncbi:MAG: RNA polymerase sigma factor [Ktedonobacterales bacterium]